MRPRSVRLTTDDLCAGSVLWLREDADAIDPCGFEKSGLPLSALSHRCMVVGLLQSADSKSDLDRILICTVRPSDTAINATDGCVTDEQPIQDLELRYPAR